MPAFTIVILPVAIFIMPFFTVIIITMWVAMRAGSTSNIVLEPLPFLLLIAKSFGHAIALPHGVLAVLVNWAWTIKELFVGSIEIALSTWLLYIVDEVFRSAAT